jgi:dTDP-4-amino-4,6-dideoxygalactose transaminase
MPPLQEYIDEISSLWDSHWLTNMGVEHQKLEASLKERLGVENIALFTNGHNALECILEALDLPEQGEVITTPFTFASTTHAIVRKNLVPVFADVKIEDFTLDPQSIESLITPRTVAIVPVHVYGLPCDVEAIQQIADRYGLKVIYDAAHAFNVKLGGRNIATFGDASMFSFHATKVFNTIEGGAVCFKDSSLYPVLNHWKNFGIVGPERVVYSGGNAKMNEFCAAMGVCNLRHLDDEIAKRKMVSERYWTNLSGLPGVRTFQPSAGVEYNYAYLPVTFDPDLFGASRDEVFEALAKNDIGARKYFYPLVSDYERYRSVYASERTPVAQRAANTVLTLPLYADLTIENVDRICSIVKSCAR